jgi:hypothetical protein
MAAVWARHLELGFADLARSTWTHRVVAGAGRMAAAVRPERERRAPLPVAVVRCIMMLATMPSWVD